MALKNIFQRDLSLPVGNSEKVLKKKTKDEVCRCKIEVVGKAWDDYVNSKE